MKKALEMIAVIVVVVCLISVSVILTHKAENDARTAPSGTMDEAPATFVIGGP